MMNILDLPTDTLIFVASLSENPMGLECTCTALRTASLSATHRLVKLKNPPGGKLARFIATHRVRRMDISFFGAKEDAMIESLEIAAASGKTDRNVRFLSLRFPRNTAIKKSVTTLLCVDTVFPALRTLAIYAYGLQTPEFVVFPDAPRFSALVKVVAFCRESGANGNVEFILGRRLPKLEKLGVVHV